ncbi:MAG: hypothetical protein BWK80_56360 [Desulfobacteraceae bacterium IS3]|nr:MAG: hypothetical protein BWK80_56360 [Desulfobacteraceae bacterium IS3]
MKKSLIVIVAFIFAICAVQVINAVPVSATDKPAVAAPPADQQPAAAPAVAPAAEGEKVQKEEGAPADDEAAKEGEEGDKEAKEGDKEAKPEKKQQ